jgi:hypothetical protein
LQVATVSGEALADLDGQLAGRGEDQRADGTLDLLWRLPAGMQFLQDGDGEGGRFAGAGLCATQQVAALDQVRDGLFLDRGRVGVAFGLEGLSKWAR